MAGYLKICCLRSFAASKLQGLWGWREWKRIVRGFQIPEL